MCTCKNEVTICRETKDPGEQHWEAYQELIWTCFKCELPIGHPGGNTEENPDSENSESNTEIWKLTF